MPNNLPEPIPRKEKFLASAAGMAVETPTPITKEEIYLDAIAKGGGSGDAYTKAETDQLIDGKVDKETGKGLSANDFTDAYKAAVDGAAPQSTTYTKNEVDAALSGKQPTLTTAQQAAVDSGITAVKVQQFEGKADAPVESYITEESQLDELSQGTIMALLGTIVAGYEAGTWAVIRTYYLNAAKSRRMQIIEHQGGDRKMRFYKDAWGSWT